MAKRKDEIITQAPEEIETAPQPPKNLALTPEQVSQMSAQETTDLINLLQGNQAAQTTQLLTSLYQGLNQQNGAAAEALNMLLQVTQSQGNRGLQNVITQHYGSAIAGQAAATQQLIQDIGEGEQSLNFLGSLGLQSEIAELGIRQPEIAAGDGLSDILALAPDESEGEPDDESAIAPEDQGDRHQALSEAGF